MQGGYFAHSRPDAGQETWELLAVHLGQVAERAREHAAVFGSGEWGYLAGLLHDVGKYRQEFQQRIRGSGEHAPHAAAGAALAQERGALPVAFAVAGHHAGLGNAQAQGDTRQRPLAQVVADGRPVLDQIRASLPQEIWSAATPPAPAHLASLPRDRSMTLAQEMWIRFLFSAVVDADRLATEAFYYPARRASVRDFATTAMLRAQLDESLARFTASSDVNRLRAEVLRDCRAAAKWPPGLFSLTVPTGGGKTLSSLAFALHHAERHGLRRVIVVIPYTSIIEQTARVFKCVLGDGNVVEHHSALDEERAHEESAEREVRRRLAVENWEAPVVVTTTVQFFETLFSNHPSRCRKLHNVARSVVIIDEAQTLPPRFLHCVLDAIRELVRGYGCSVVLSTATQPALGKREALPEGLEHVREIVTKPARLARALERVDVRWPASEAPPTPYTEVATEMAAHRRVMGIVHRRHDARRLAEMLPAEGLFHLSALMCAAHRSAVLVAIKSALADSDAVCRVVATQLVEAGVDVDFPVVYRAMGGLDSMAQAAGRCNREGTMRDPQGRQVRGSFAVFLAETAPPPGVQAALAVTRGMLAAYGDALSITDQSQLTEYFRLFYQTEDHDARSVMPEREALNFASVAAKVRLIDDGFAQPVVVPWGDGPARARELRHRLDVGAPARGSLRALQPFVVQVRERDLAKLQRLGALESLEGFGYQLVPPYEHLYDQTFGLRIDEDASGDAAALVV